MKSTDIVPVLIFLSLACAPFACGTNKQVVPQDDNKTDSEAPGFETSSQLGEGGNEEDSASLRDTGDTEGGSEISNPDYAVPYYHLRIELSSTSSWAKLEIDPELVLRLGEPRIEGSGDRIRARFDMVEVVDPAGGNQAKVSADYAVPPTAIENGLGNMFGPLEKGSSGEAVVRVFGVSDGGELTLMGSAIAPPRVAEAKIDFELDKVHSVGTKTTRTVAVRPMAWAVYYPWYRDRNPFENDNLAELTGAREDLTERVEQYWRVRRHPNIYQSGSREYSLLDRPSGPEQVGMFSYDRVAVCLQVDQAQERGIDGFLAEYLGEDSFTHGATGIVIDCAEENDFRVGMLVSPQGALADAGKDMDRAADLLFRWIRAYAETYGDSPSVMKVEGRLLAVTYSTGLLEPHHWSRLRQKLRDAGADVFLVADNASSNEFEEYIPYFDGADGVSMNDETGAWLGRQLRYNGIFTDERPKLWMRDVRPGYDDTHLYHRSKARYVDREDGNFFHRQFDEAVAHDPQWIRITSWNEYYENTYIEPSAVHGTKYLDIAAERINRWKGE